MKSWLILIKIFKILGSEVSLSEAAKGHAAEHSRLFENSQINFGDGFKNLDWEEKHYAANADDLTFTGWNKLPDEILNLTTPYHFGER